jgi:hypothetical protein
MNLAELKNEMPKIFKKVKNDVKRVLGRHRVGLSLGLVDMGIYQGGFIGGMHFSPGTDIVLNRSPLRVILESQPYEIVWAYTYHILLHEYIHSLRFIKGVDTEGKPKNLSLDDENLCREVTLTVSREIFKEADHPAIILAEHGIGIFIPNLKVTNISPFRRPDGMIIEYITDFDEESHSYYS